MSLKRRFAVDSSPRQCVGGYRAWDISESSGTVPMDLIWISLADKYSPVPHRVLPLCEPSVAVRRRRDTRDEVTSIELVVCGPYEFAQWYRPEPQEELIAVRLKPETAAAVFGIAPTDYLNSAPVADIGLLARRLSATLHAAESGSALEVASVLAMDLLRVAANVDVKKRVEAAVATRIRAAGGALNVSDIAADLGVSERHIRRRFQATIGCSPKTYARRVRLATAAAAADAAAAPDWARIALDAGYCDQSHMIADFRALIGLTPGAAHAERVLQPIVGDRSAFSYTRPTA